MSDYSPVISYSDLDIDGVEQFLPGPVDPLHMLYSHNGRHIAINDAWGPSIPYRSEQRSTGSSNHGYRSIKGNPQAAALIPEAQGCPPILTFLERANHQDLRVETAGCEKGTFENSAYEPPLAYIGNYYSILFSSLEENSLQNHIQFALDITNCFSGCEDYWTTLEITIEGSRSNYRPPIWINHTKVMSHGETEDQRLGHLNIALTNLSEMIAQKYSHA